MTQMAQMSQYEQADARLRPNRFTPSTEPNARPSALGLLTSIAGSIDAEIDSLHDLTARLTKFADGLGCPLLPEAPRPPQSESVSGAGLMTDLHNATARLRAARQEASAALSRLGV